jgi:hypothetical protein
MRAVRLYLENRALDLAEKMTKAVQEMRYADAALYQARIEEGLVTLKNFKTVP